MIIYGVCIGNERRYADIAADGLEQVVGDKDHVLERRNQTSLFEAYDSILEEAASFQGVEALVLLHEDVRVGAGFADEVRHAVAQPGVGVAGCVGARNPRSLEWWKSHELYGHVRESRGELDWSHGVHDVHTVDGLLLVLSPWALDQLRFGAPGYRGFHGYADELCFRALERRRRVIVDDFDVEHLTRGGYGDRVDFVRADLVWRRRWQDADSYAGRRWDLLPGVWHLSYAAAPVWLAIRGLLGRLRDRLIGTSKSW